MYDFYLGGPMRGYPELNFPLFIKAAEMLRAEGNKIWNPAEHGNYTQTSFAECMTEDLLAVIQECDNVLFLPGWRKSLGANMEAFCAFACGKRAYELTGRDGDLDFPLNLVEIDLSEYAMPYGECRRKYDNPHQIDLGCGS